MVFQRQRRPKDVPKMEALREDVKDANSKDKDAKDKLDVFLMLWDVHGWVVVAQDEVSAYR